MFPSDTPVPKSTKTGGAIGKISSSCRDENNKIASFCTENRKIPQKNMEIPQKSIKSLAKSQENPAKTPEKARKKRGPC